MDNPYDPTLPEDTAGRSSDASDRGTLSKMWDSWTAKPENNAALMQFGLNMMAPNVTGGGFLGHVAQGLGGGMEARDRSVAAEQEREKSEEELALKERAAASKEREVGAYEEMAKSRGAGGLRKLGPLELQVIGQKALNSWANKPSDILSGDTYVNTIKSRHPEVKGSGPKGELTKGDIMADPRLRKEVQQMMTPSGDQYTGGILGGATTMDAAGTGGGASPQDQQALAWARANPSDPRAAQILARLGQQ
jgi:hypothetical protein